MGSMFMKHFPAMVVCAGLLTALVPFPQEGTEQGRRLFEKDCRACHVVPDPSIRADKIWLDLLSSTA